MSALAIAHSIFLLHLAFIVFAVMGGALIWWRRQFIYLHLPALAWGLWIELSHGQCPLTALESSWLVRAGVEGYGGGFIEQYLVPVIYPAGLQPQQQVWLAVALLALNAFWYALAWRRHGRPTFIPVSTA